MEHNAIMECIGEIKVQQGRHDEQIAANRSTIEKAWDAIDGIRDAIGELKVSSAKIMVLVALFQSIVTAVLVHFLTKA